MTVEEEWASLVEPWRAAAAPLGFGFLDRSIKSGIPPSPDTTFGCIDFLFDGDATYLDLSGTIARGKHHRGLLIGFNGIQLYTFLRTPHVSLVLTNGEPPAATKRLERAKWNPLFMLAEALIPKSEKSVKLAGPQDLHLVIAHHRERVRARGGTPIKPEGAPLDFRWSITEEWEKSERPW